MYLLKTNKKPNLHYHSSFNWPEENFCLPAVKTRYIYIYLLSQSGAEIFSYFPLFGVHST